MNPKASNLNRTLGLPMLAFYGTGMILGAGIYSIIGKAAGHAGQGLWQSFALAALAAVLTALSYAELTSMFPKAAAEFVYLGEAFPQRRWIGSAIGVGIAFSGAATAAAVAMAFSGYLRQFVDVPAGPAAAGLLTLFFGIAVLGIQASGWMNILFTLIETGGLLLLIGLGASSDRFGQALATAPTFGVLSGAALVVFSFFGFENIVNLSEEAREPERDVPRAIFLSLAVASILYFLVSLAAVALLSPEKLAGSEAALMSAAQGRSPGLGRALGIIALFSTANTALISMVGASRVVYGMAQDRALPRILGRVLPGRKTPWLASAAIWLTALSLLPLGDIEAVAGVSSFTTMTAFLLVNIALIQLRFTQPGAERPFRSPLSIAKVPLLPVLGGALAVAFLTQFEAQVYAIAGGLLSAVALAFWLHNWKRSR